VIEKHGDILAIDTLLQDAALTFVQHADLYCALSQSDSAGARRRRIAFRGHERYYNGEEPRTPA
jgi:hypothetical protein